MQPIKLTNEYIRGLIDGEGCFTFHTSKTTRKGAEVRIKIPAFVLSMHERDKELIEAVRDHLNLKDKVHIFKSYKGDGYNRGDKAVLSIRGLGALKNTIVPFFYRRLIGYKSKQFNAWLEKIGNDSFVSERYKLIYRLHKCGFYERNPKFLD